MTEGRKEDENENQRKYFQYVYETLKNNNGNWPCGTCGKPCYQKQITEVGKHSGKLIPVTLYYCEGGMERGIHSYHHPIDDEILLAVKEKIMEENENRGS